MGAVVKDHGYKPAQGPLRLNVMSLQLESQQLPESKEVFPGTRRTTEPFSVIYNEATAKVTAGEASFGQFVAVPADVWDRVRTELLVLADELEENADGRCESLRELFEEPAKLKPRRGIHRS